MTKNRAARYPFRMIFRQSAGRRAAQRKEVAILPVRVCERRYDTVIHHGTELCECPIDAREGKLAPGNVFPGEKPDLQAFLTRRENRLGERRAIHDLHLRDARNIVDREKITHRNIRIGLFARFAPRPVLGRLALFHETGRQGPETAPWLNRAAAKKELIAIGHDRTDNDLRIYVIDEAAAVADIARETVSRWHAPRKGDFCFSARLPGHGYGRHFLVCV